MSRKETQNRFIAVLAVLLFALAAWPTAIHAQEHAQEIDSPVIAPAQVLEEEGSVVIDWGLSAEPGSVSAASAAQSLAKLRYGGYELPVELLRFRAIDGAPAPQLVIEVVESAEWDGELQPAQVLSPPVVDWETPDWLEEQLPEPALPSAPVFVHSKGRLRGTEVQIVAISPFYEEDGVPKYASRVRARMDGVRRIEGSLADMMLVEDVQAASMSAPTFGDAAALAPTNAAAAVNSVKLIVTEQGIQSISGSSLASSGLDLSDVNKLGLTFKGQPVPLEVQETIQNGKLDAADTLRFYASGIGDYWNDYQVFWLSDNNLNPARMTTRSVAPSEADPAPARATALERGVWRNNKTYDPRQAGPDLDHWFAQRMLVSPGMQGKPDEYPYPKLTATPEINLSMVPGVSTITPHVTLVQKIAEYELRVTAGEAKTVRLRPHETVDEKIVDSAGTWSPQVNTIRPFSVIELMLIPTDSRGTLLVDSIEWAVPVSLDLNNKGARFTGVDGRWRYELTDLPNSAGLYDISDPLQPVLLTGRKGNAFEDGPQAREYLVAGPGYVHSPRIEAHTAVVFSAASGAHALYIAPSQFMRPLDPLVSHREQQGYQAQVVDVQDIYDAWSYGHVDPVAIRKFLQFAVQQWKPSPISAVLVSDATRDPFNYEGKASSVNFIPPYLLSSFLDKAGNVRKLDPFWGQNGCENCYGQLDGDDPLNNDVETPGSGFMPDIWIGRFPAKNVADVEAIVAKILRYETTPDPSKVWESQALFLADNYYFVDGSTDSAGDFIESSEEAISLLPDGVRPQRLYYDPTAPDKHPWLISNSVTMHSQTQKLLGQGPGLVTYNGHSAHWQWAKTSECATPPPPGEACPSDQQNPAPYILSLYDIDGLSNGDHPYIGLSMTCFTSQFFEPADSGTVLDERAFVYPTSGAAAIWGPAGLSVAVAHDDLQYGFHKALWKITEEKPGTAKLGQLVEAGYLENFAPDVDNRGFDTDGDGRCDSGICTPCCDDVRRTFLLMGDPLMTVRLKPSHDLYLPSVLQQE